MIAVVQYCWAINDWEERLTKQLERVKNSGLYDKADELHLFITDSDMVNEEKVKLIHEKYPKYQLDYSNKNWGEGVMALQKVWDLGQEHEDGKILYFHTKGVFNKYRNFHTKEISNFKIECVEKWIELLEYFVIDNWDKCVEKLYEHDTTGVTNIGGWWWGNFWWAHSRHLKQLHRFKDYYNGSRWIAEAWIHDAHSNKNEIKFYEFYRFYFDPQASKIPRYFYEFDGPDNIEVYIEKAQYGFFALQRDEGCGLVYDKDILIDVTDFVKNIIEKNNNKFIGFEFNDELLGFNHEIGSNTEIIENELKNIRIWFKTNIDPENTYFVSSISNNSIILNH